MTQEEFNNTQFGKGDKVIYHGEEFLLASVDFEEKLLGFKVDGADCYSWARCENVTYVPLPS